MKTALIHDWLTGIGGGEKVLESILSLYPAPIYTLVKNEKKLQNTVFSNQTIHTSFLQKFPRASTLYHYYLPFFPFAIEQFDLREYELILSCSHAVAKGVLTHPKQLHLCYCSTPMRYAWDLHHTYMESIHGLKKWLAKRTLHRIRGWDVSSSNRVDHFATNSHYVAARIRKTYRRDSTVIYPPVSTDLFQIASKKEDYYFTFSRMVPYKKMDLIVETFSKMPDKRLVVIGDGPEFKKIKQKATKNIELLGSQPIHVLREYLSKAKAFIFAAEEDFGIVVVEAQAAGIPVIAYGKGGVTETVLLNKTGLFFPEQTVDSIQKAIKEFEKMEDRFNPKEIKAWAESFNEKRFQSEFKAFVDKQVNAFQSG